MNFTSQKRWIAYAILVRSCSLNDDHAKPNKKIYRLMHELLWITIFGSRVRWFANDLHEWRSHMWKSLANRITSDPKSLFTVINVSFYLLHAILCPEHTMPLKTIIDLWFLHCHKGRSDLALWRHHSWSLTSHERGILALWRHIRRLLLHAQIGAKAIFTSG